MSEHPPKSVKFLLCDDVRAEANGKLTLVGLYPADRIVILSKGNVKPEGSVALLTQLAIVCFASDGEGRHSARVILTGPSGQHLLDGVLGEFTLQKGSVATLVVQGPNFAVPEYGKYMLRIVFGETEFIYEFNISPAAQQTQTAGESTATVKPKKKASKRFERG